MAGPLFLQHFILIAPTHALHRSSVDVSVEDGKLVQIGPTGSISPPEAAQVIIGGMDAYLSPGWVDMHCLLADPGQEPIESLAALAKASVRGGFTRLLGYPNTQPILDNSQMIAAVQARSEALPIILHLCGALTEQTQGVELAELYDMQQAGALAFGDGSHPVTRAGTLLRALRYAQAFDGLLIHYPTTPDMVRDGQMNEGKQSTLLGMPGIPEEAESIALARDLEIWSYAPQRMHLQPITSPSALALLKKRNAPEPMLSVGCPIYYFLLDESRVADFDAMVKVFPPLRSPQQIQALLQALAEGDIDVITSGHQARDQEDKDVPFPAAAPGMHSLSTFFPMVVASLLASNILSIEQFLERVSIRPREILGLEQVGFAPGDAAEYTLFAPDRIWDFEAKLIEGRACNSPLLGQSLQGQVIGIVQKGRYTPASYH